MAESSDEGSVSWVLPGSLDGVILPVMCCLPMAFMTLHISSEGSMPTSQYLECSCHCMGAERLWVGGVHPSSRAERQQGLHRADLLLPAASKHMRGFDMH